MRENINVVQERTYGLWYWENIYDGKFLSDGDGRFLTMPGKQTDLACVKLMRDAARSLGVEDEGRPVWRSGHRKVTDAEFDLGMERLLDGKEFDPAEEYLQAEENMRKEGNK